MAVRDRNPGLAKPDGGNQLPCLRGMIRLTLDPRQPRRQAGEEDGKLLSRGYAYRPRIRLRHSCPRRDHTLRTELARKPFLADALNHPFDGALLLRHPGIVLFGRRLSPSCERNLRWLDRLRFPVLSHLLHAIRIPHRRLLDRLPAVPGTQFCSDRRFLRHLDRLHRQYCDM